jgi:hypothetical protein
MKRSIFLLATASMLASCAQGESTASEAPAAEPPPLEKRIMFEREEQRDGNTITKHVAAFGNWAAECTYSRGARPSLSWCDVYPWSGALPKRDTVLTPYQERATVQYYDQKPVKIVLNTPPRAAGSKLSYACGYKTWSEAHNPTQLKFFYEADAQSFVTAMQTSDCVIVYKPANGGDEVSLTRASHGFRQANEYARNYSHYPKADI